MAKPIVCQCCKQAKNKIDAKPSALITSMSIIICQACMKEGHEPRHIVVLAAKSRVDASDYIKLRRYCGKSLEAIEVTP